MRIDPLTRNMGGINPHQHMDSIGTQSAGAVVYSLLLQESNVFIATGGGRITIQIQKQEITAKKISLERMKIRSREYRANGENAVRRSSLTPALRSLILRAADGRPCPTCETPMQRIPGVENPNTATIEHILPIKEGGANEPENLIAMCLACNRARGYAYAQSRGARGEIDDVLEWLFFQLHQQRLAQVVELDLRVLYPQHQDIFEKNWLNQYLRINKNGNRR